MILDKSPDEEVDGSKTTECQMNGLQRSQTGLCHSEMTTKIRISKRNVYLIILAEADCLLTLVSDEF